MDQINPQSLLLVGEKRVGEGEPFIVTAGRLVVEPGELEAVGVEQRRYRLEATYSYLGLVERHLDEHHLDGVSVQDRLCAPKDLEVESLGIYFQQVDRADGVCARSG